MAYSNRIERVPDENKWSHQALAAVKSTPWSLREIPDVTVTFSEPAEHVQVPTRESSVAVRDFRINRSDLEKFGYIDGCEMCKHTFETGRGKSGGSHTERCRARIMSELAPATPRRPRVEGR